jgi:hypothetical protein
MNPKQEARLLMEALAVLHQRGYGRLKLYCYIKEGLGVWRNCVFASDEFPDSIQAWPGPKCHGSIPGHSKFEGGTVEEVAESVLARCGNAVAEAARGHDESYVTWYREMLAAYPDGILQMESAHRAHILDYGDIGLPALKAWTEPPPTLEGREQLFATLAAEREKVIERARHRHLKRRRSK